MKLYHGHPDQRFGSVTYAQHGDDLMLLNLCHLLGIDRPSYLDLGAHHPETISNTKLLYDRGSRGVNVDANPSLIAAFERERPEDINLCVGVGPESGLKTFYMYSDTSGRNTFSAEEVRTQSSGLQVKRTVELEMVTVNDIVEKHCRCIWPDILLSDLEGLDYDVLNSAQFMPGNAPSIIVVETPKRMTRLMRDMLAGVFSVNRPVKYYVHCRMGENLFFLRADICGDALL